MNADCCSKCKISAAGVLHVFPPAGRKCEGAVNQYLVPSHTASAQVERAARLSITNCIFLRLSPGSVTVQQTNTVVVQNNQLAINAMVAVVAADGSHLTISCNRLLGDPVPAECLHTTTTTTTTSTSTSTVSTVRLPATTTGRTASSALLAPGAGTGGTGLVPGQALLGAAGGALAVLLLLLLVMLAVASRRRSQHSADYVLHAETSVIPVPPPPPPAQPSHQPRRLRLPAEDFPPLQQNPLWLEEIQNNSIFNKQRKKFAVDDTEL